MVLTGSYIDRYALANAKHPSPYSTATTVVDASHVHHCAAPNTDNPSSHPTHNNVVLTGSYIDRYALTNAKHPSPYSTATKTVVDASHVDHCATPNIDHPTSQPTYSDTISTGCYIDYYTASDINQSVPHTKSAATPEGHVDHNAPSNAKHPTLLSSPMHVDTVSTGSYIDRYSASIATQPLSCYDTATAKDGNNDGQCGAFSSNHPVSFPTYTDTLSTGSYVDRYTASNGNHESIHSCNGTTLPTAVGKSYTAHSNALSNTSALTKHPVCIDTSAEGIYIGHSTLLSDDRPQSGASTTVIKRDHIDHCITSNIDQPLPNSVDGTSATGIYVDYNMASNNSSKLTKAKAADSKHKSSCNSSCTIERDSCPSPITGVYLPYSTAMKGNATTNSANANSTVSKASTANQAKRKPGGLYLPTGNTFSYSLLNESTPTPTFGSLSANDCETPNVGEYIAHDNLETLGMTNHYKPTTNSNHPVSFPVASYSTRSHSTANSGYFDYKTATHQGSASKASSAQSHMQQHTNVPTMPFPNVAFKQNVNGYVTESDI